MQDILISIIVPVYNGETYLDRCFSSITRQSYKNIECLFVDDGSKDTSYKKLSEFTMNYSGNITFRIIRHEENKGLSAARNTGILNATGEYLYFLDADD
jgi:glycosyltransferase involved in cell wall biosynthesis